MKSGYTLFLLLCPALTVATTAYARTPDTATTAPCLLVGAPTFDLSTSQFREDLSSQNPSPSPNEFRAIDSSLNEANLTRIASKINGDLYAFAALERDTLKIKSIQVTWLPIQGPEQKAARAKTQKYMAIVIHTLTPLMTKAQSQKELQPLLMAGRDKRYYTEAGGVLRYVVASNGEKGSTFAVESIRPALSEPLESLNR